MTRARTHKSKPRKRRIRVAKTAAAREAIGTIEPGCEVYVLTYGQFSLIDALVAILEQTGPADVCVSTWSAARADLERSMKLLESADIRSMRWLVDRSFLTRKPKECALLRRLFGDDCIRTLSTHAKFLTIRNERWSLAIRTSMNLNGNPRLENIEISDDDALCEFMERAVDEVFGEQEPGLFNEYLPGLANLADVADPTSVKAGTIDVGKLNRASVGGVGTS